MPALRHICPEFMEDFGLTVEDLKIRSLIHCASVMKNLVDVKQVSKWSWRYFVLWREMRRVLRKYPPDKFPHYYRPVWRPDERAWPIREQKVTGRLTGARAGGGRA